MKLPNADQAQISRNKILNYLLSIKHPVGKTKAKFFRKAGFSGTNVNLLEKELLNLAKNASVTAVRETKYGTNYGINGSIKAPTGVKINVTTVWFIESEGENPTFVTAYPM